MSQISGPFYLDDYFVEDIYYDQVSEPENNGKRKSTYALSDVETKILKQAKIEQTDKKISRKTSDHLVKLFEQMPEEQIQNLLNQIDMLKTPDLPIRIDVQKLLGPDEFLLNQSDNEEQESVENS